MLAVAISLALAGISAALADDQMQEKGDRPTVSKDRPVRATLPGVRLACTDLRVKLSLRKSIVGTDGRVQLTGRVCNDGPTAYAVPPGDIIAVFYQQTRHPPLTFGQEQSPSVVLGFRRITPLARGQCMTIEQLATLPGAVRWGNDALRKGERRAEAAFTIRLERNAPGGGFPLREQECNPNNDTATEHVKYMERAAVPVRPSGLRLKND
jgi:hypothetical protein